MELIKKLFLIIIMIFIISCEKETSTSDYDRIKGVWVSENKYDTLEFVDNSSMYRSSGYMRHDHYDYALLGDSIKIGYNGILYILVKPTVHSFNLSDESLSIDFSNKRCYGFGLEKIDFHKLE